MAFPNNPSDGQIFYDDYGVKHIYDSSTRSWDIVPGEQITAATPLSSGIMTKEDYVKLTGLKVPPLQSSITGEECDAVFVGGTVGLYSKNKSLDIEHIIKVSQTTAPFSLWSNIVGYDFRINFEKLIAEAKSRGNFTQQTIQGPKGDTGPIGEDGIDKLDTGPIGDSGPDGSNSTFTGTVSPEPINVVINNENSNKAIVDITTNEVSATENYLKITRANIGNTNACPEFVSPKNFQTPWLLVINEGALQLRRSVRETVGDACLTCLVCGSSVYYVNMGPILNAIKNRYDTLLNKLKEHKEELYKTWLKAMVSTFNEQKAALCCALENCMSRSRNVDARRYIEQQRIQAAQADFKLVIGDENDKVKMDTNFGKNCSSFAVVDDNVVFGDCDLGECTARITLDGSLHSYDPRVGGQNATITKFILPAGQYHAEITGCCAYVQPGFTSSGASSVPDPRTLKAGLSINNNNISRIYSRFVKYTGRVSILYTGVVGGVETPLIASISDFGTPLSAAEAQNTYLGTSTTFDHQGGELFIWIIDPDNNTGNNGGSIEVCIREIDCLGGNLSGSDITAGIDRIYIYRNSISSDNNIGIIKSYEGQLSTEANYGFLNDSANLTHGPTLEEGVFKLFMYQGSEGIAFFAVGNSQGGNFTGTVKSNISVSGASTVSLEVSDDPNELVRTNNTYSPNLQTQTAEYEGNWIGKNDTLGGAFNLNTASDQWIIEFTPTDFDNLIKFSIEDGSKTPIIVSQDPTGLGKVVSTTSNDPQELISYIGTVSTSYGGPHGMALTNTVLDQDMILTYTVPATLGSNKHVDYIRIGLKAEKLISISLTVVNVNGITYNYGIRTVEAESVYSYIDYDQPITITDNNGDASKAALYIDEISQVKITIHKAPSGSPLVNFGILKAILDDGSDIIIESFGCVLNIPYGSEWRAAITYPRMTAERRRSGGDGGETDVDTVKDIVNTLITSPTSRFTGVPVAGLIKYVIGSDPFSGPTTADPSVAYEDLPLVSYYGNCTPLKQAKTLFDGGKNKLTIARKELVPQNTTKIEATVQYAHELEYLLVNDNIIIDNMHHGGCAQSHTFEIPLSMVNIGEENTFAFHVDANKGSYGYLTLQITSENSDPNVCLRERWIVDAENNLDNALTKILLTPIPPTDGCQVFYTKVDWYLRGHRIGAACSFSVEIDGLHYIVVKRSFDIDTTCGGGESINNFCITSFIDAGLGHPSLAWPTVNGIEGIGVPTSGYVNFVRNDSLNQAIMAKITDNDISNIVGDPNQHEIILFPVLS